MKKLENLKNKKGFTLIELIVVIAILGILMLILVPSFLGYADDAKEQVAKANTRTVWTAAKAAESVTEYTTGMKVEDCTETNGVVTGTGFCGEIAKKAGDPFNGKFQVKTGGTPAKVTSVIMKTNGKTCTYTGAESKMTCEDTKID